MTNISMTTGFRQVTPLQPAQDGFDALFDNNQPRSRYDTLVAVRQGLHARAQRGRFFSARLFSDPAWDMLLELYAASLARRRLSVSRLAERARVPLTTALRWISALEKDGAVERQADPLDGRRVFIMLSEEGRSAMSAYFDQLPADAIIL